jgi:hypothetical protein
MFTYVRAIRYRYFIGDGGHEQVTSNGERFNPAFAERDKKQTMVDLRGRSTNWFKNQFL